MTNLKAHISPHTSWRVSYPARTTATPNASLAVPPAKLLLSGPASQYSWWVTALQLAYYLLVWINWIFYHPQRMLHTLTVTNLLPNFISVYQWPSRWSKRQDSWLSSVSQKVTSPSLERDIWKWDICRCNQVKWGHTILGWALMSLKEEGNLNTETEAETGIMLL